MDKLRSTQEREVKLHDVDQIFHEVVSRDRKEYVFRMCMIS